MKEIFATQEDKLKAQKFDIEYFDGDRFSDMEAITIIQNFGLKL